MFFFYSLKLSDRDGIETFLLVRFLFEYAKVYQNRLIISRYRKIGKLYQAFLVFGVG